MTAEHSIAPEQVMAYLDGELPPARAREILAHLAGCDACRQIADDLRGVSQQMTTWSIEPPPAGLRLPAADLAEAKFVRRPFWRSAAVWIAAPAAAVVLISAIRLAQSGFFVASKPASTPTMAVTLGGSVEGQPSPGSGGGPRVSAAMPRRAQATGQGADSIRQPAESAAGPLIARTARLQVLVDSIDASRTALERIARELNGFIGDISAGGQQSRWVHATLRVPADKLDATTSAVRALGKVLEESQQGEDVTEQSLDIDARISNGRRTEQRLVQLLTNRTGSLEDVLAVERELARVRTELEQLDASRKNLDRRITDATVRVEISEQARPAVTLGPTRFTTRLRNAAVDGVRSALQSLVDVLLFAIEVGPFLLVWALMLALPARFALRWWRQRQSSAA
jgi:hypothetical protein